jgi:RNA polymerase sigma-70 factor (ECF subfamily)
MTNPQISDEVRDAARTAWRRYLDVLTPFRPELHRYCRGLTGDVWDAEDLVQETLLKGFASLGSVNVSIANPRGYLVRIASHLWIDGHRRNVLETSALAMLDDDGVTTQPDRDRMRAAAARLLERLSPQERAAVVLKDVFDMTLAEIAEALSTSVGAVKAALHHGRGRLKNASPTRVRIASAALVDRFVERLDAGDLAGLLSLMLDTAAVEMPGALIEVGRREFERKGSWLWQEVNVHPDLPPEVRPPKWSNRRVMFQGEPIVLGLAPAPDGPRLQGITRFEEDDGKIARIRSYCFSPETAAEVAQAFGLEVGWIPYRFPTPA